MPPGIPPAKRALFVDSKECSGCRLCQMVCSLWHDGAVNLERARLFVLNDEEGGIHYSHNHCRQCQSPECMLVCPTTDAMTVDERTGARVIVEDKCIGCGFCVKACYFNTVGFDSKRNVALKCDLCRGDPQCVKWCPHNCIRYEKAEL